MYMYFKDFSGYLSFAQQPHPLCGTRKPQAMDNGSGAMLKLHTCKLAHAHLLFALVITNTITLCARFIHICTDTPPLTTYVCLYMHVLITGHNYYILLAFSLYWWPSPYTVGLLPVLLAFSLYCWPSLKFFILSMHGITYM